MLKFLQKFKGSEWVGTEYIPLFNYFIEIREQGSYRFMAANLVTSDNGTNIVLCAPVFMMTIIKAGIITSSDLLVPIDSNGRFLESAKDFFGSSIEELIQLSRGENIKDLHREYIDHIKIQSKQGKGVLRRIKEVFDFWFEIGSMPFVQQYYPFQRKELFETIFPSDFIVEGFRLNNRLVLQIECYSNIFT